MKNETKAYRLWSPKGRVQFAYDNKGGEAPAMKQALKDELNVARVKRWFRLWGALKLAAEKAAAKKKAATKKAPVKAATKAKGGRRAAAAVPVKGKTTKAAGKAPAKRKAAAAKRATGAVKRSKR